MSSILKALKKLEDEKATLRPGCMKIDSDILRVDNSQLFSTVSIILSALLLFAAGSLATYMYMKKEPAPIVDVNKKKLEVLPKNKPLTQVPLPATLEIKAEKLPESIEIMPAQQSKTTMVVSPGFKKHVTTIKLAPAVMSKPDTRIKRAELKNNSTITTNQSPVTVNIFPVLTVNGIAYQDDSADSLAVVNGLPVSGGTMIEGAKVEIIQKDRVHFSYKGKMFDILLGKSNR